MKRSLHLFSVLWVVALLVGSQMNLTAQEYRAIDGANNNFLKPTWGTVGAQVTYVSAPAYSDGVSEPAGLGRPNPRAISNAIFAQNTMAEDPRGMSAFTWAWGQFIDHDITLVPDNHEESMPIAVPPFDAFFDPYGSGMVTIPMLRSAYDPTTGTSPENPRRHINAITAFIDASSVYGSDETRAYWLRSFSGGKLRVSTGNMPPFNTTTGEYGAPIDPTAPPMAMPLPYVTKWFVVGDDRGNENPFLTAMHTLFLREHNRLCDELAVAHPDWTDEQLYQHARKLVGAVVQAIVYEEWLPALGMDMEPYNGYNPYTDPGIMNVFSAAAFRYGHTTINNTLLRMDDDGHTMPQGNIDLRDAFFNPQAIIEVGGIEPFFIGMSTVVQQNFDCKVIDDLRNFLFGPPGAGGLDLVSLNLNRGRDRGLADYNTIRADFGMAPKESFSAICSDPLMSASLQQVYHDVNHIDPWVGMLAE
ncbi:MAG: peroxidase family protein, partial [Phaeodactylibacter sp.]|nr:peroxidase family protein [Phaeodactylibacter sp.]